jgi:hypothetical protein
MAWQNRFQSFYDTSEWVAAGWLSTDKNNKVFTTKKRPVIRDDGYLSNALFSAPLFK